MIEGILAILIGMIVAGVGFHTVIKYNGSRSLNRAFLFLSISFLCYGIAESYYLTFDQYEIDAYPSIADAFYVGYFIFGILHVFETLKYFKYRKRIMSARNLAVVSLIMTVSISMYLAYSIGIEDITTFDILFGLVFVLFASVMGSSALVAIWTMRKNMLKTAWILIGLAIAISSFTDVWYYTYENVYGYSYWVEPPMDILWFITDLMMVAGILLHRRIVNEK